MEIKITNLLDRIEHHDIVVPSFQREYEWGEDQAKKLMASLFSGYPTGSLLFWETANPPELKNIGYTPTPGKLHQVILDGQQRMTTLYMLIKGNIPPYYHKQEIIHDPRRLYFNAETGEFKYVSDRERGLNPLWLRVPDAFQSPPDAFELAEKRLGEGSAEARVLYRVVNANLNTLAKILDQVYPIQIVPNSARIEDAIRVFDLVNRQGTRLSEADLALAQISGKWPEARNVFKQKLDELASKRFAFDLTFITRCMTAVVAGRALYETIHPRTKAELIAGWEKLKGVLDYLVDILPNHAFVHSVNDLNTTNVLVPLVAYLASNNGVFASSQEQNRFLHWMYAALMWGRYSGQTDQRLDKDIAIVLKSPTPTTDLEKEILDQRGRIAVRVSDLEGRDIRNALYRMAFIVAKSRKAVDWTTGAPLSNVDIYSGQNFYVFHYDLLYKTYDSASHRDRQLINEIANRVVLAKWPALTLDPAAPLGYLEGVEKKYPGSLAAYFIPQDRNLWKIERYEEFLAARRNLIVRSINDYMDALVQDTAPEQQDLAAIIKAGETDTVEFKESLRLNLYTNAVDSNLKEKLAKEAAAFLNAQGGLILIGVRDDGSLAGIDRDVESFTSGAKAGTEDDYRLYIEGAIKDRLGMEQLGYVRVRFETVDSVRIGVMDIDAAPQPVYFGVTPGQRDFYARVGAAAQKFDAAGLIAYRDSHWQEA